MLILLLFSALPQTASDPIYYVDLIELNHQYSEKWNFCYDQYIFYNWERDQYLNYNYVCTSWCTVKSREKLTPEELELKTREKRKKYFDEHPNSKLKLENIVYEPKFLSYGYPDRYKEYYQVRFFKSGSSCLVRSKLYIETWTNYDPELKNRELLPAIKRKGIMGNK